MLINYDIGFDVQLYTFLFGLSETKLYKQITHHQNIAHMHYPNRKWRHPTSTLWIK